MFVAGIDIGSVAAKFLIMNENDGVVSYVVNDTSPDIERLAEQLRSQALKEAGLRNQVRVIIGGAPVSKEFADDIEADGYAPDAGSAALLAKKIVTER